MPFASHFWAISQPYLFLISVTVCGASSKAKRVPVMWGLADSIAFLFVLVSFCFQPGKGKVVLFLSCFSLLFHFQLLLSCYSFFSSVLLSLLYFCPFYPCYHFCTVVVFRRLAGSKGKHITVIPVLLLVFISSPFQPLAPGPFYIIVNCRNICEGEPLGEPTPGKQRAFLWNSLAYFWPLASGP